MASPVFDPEVEPQAGGKRQSGPAGFRVNASGATSIEYALIAGLIFVAVIGSMRLYAARVSTVYQTIGNTISQN